MADHPSENDIDKSPFVSRESTSAQMLPGARASRRLQQRLGVDTSVVLHLIDLAANVQGRIIDISVGGCHVRTDRPFPVGIFRRVEIEFRIEGLPFRLGGVTQALYDPINVGVRFLDLSDRRREQLLQLIDEIKKLERVPD